MTALFGLKIPEKIKKPIKIGNDIYLTNDSSHFAKQIKPEQYLSIGTLEGRYLFSGNPVIFSKMSTTKIDESHIHIVNFMRDCLAFLHSLWIAEDNSVNVELGFAVSGKTAHVHSNSLSYHYWTCEGTKEELSITPSRLMEIYDEFGSKFSGMAVDSEPGHTMQRKEIDRVNIGVNFLQQARSTPDIGFKIASYCSLFEALLSTTNVELSHQMAERAAFYLRIEPQERLELYKNLKQAYNVRSKVVHGDYISKRDMSMLGEIAHRCDSTARELLSKYFYDEEFSAAIDDLSNEQLDKFFLHTIFGLNNDNT